MVLRRQHMQRHSRHIKSIYSIYELAMAKTNGLRLAVDVCVLCLCRPVDTGCGCVRLWYRIERERRKDMRIARAVESESKSEWCSSMWHTNESNSRLKEYRCIRFVFILHFGECSMARLTVNFMCVHLLNACDVRRAVPLFQCVRTDDITKLNANKSNDSELKCYSP